MTGLLVSVRSAAEAKISLAGGADLIDVKEPRRGALGAADPSVWRTVTQSVATCVPTSVALGELIDFGEFESCDLAGVQYAKVGLAGCRQYSDWAARWTECVRSLPEGLEPVAVVYGDYRAAAAPAPEQVIDQAGKAGCGVVLFDTFDKSRGDLIRHLGLEGIERLSSRARQRIGRVVFGGSLDAHSAALLLPFQPDYIAVRGAVCRPTRIDSVDRELVENLARVVHGR